MKSLHFFTVLALFTTMSCAYINWGKTVTKKQAKLGRWDCMKLCDTILHKKRLKDACVACCSRPSDDLSRCRPKGLVAYPKFFSKWDFRKKIFGDKRPWYMPKYDPTRV